MKKILACPFLLLLMFALTPVLAQSNRLVLLEYYTGSWCGLCPEGSVTLDSAINEFGMAQIMPVGVHISDPMSIPACVELSDAYTGGGVNIFMVDRYLFPDLDFVQFTFQYPKLGEKIAERLAGEPAVELRLENLDYNAAADSLSVTVVAEFASDLPPADRRFNLWLTEDSVVYMQTNYFDPYPGHLYEGAGNPIPEFTHRNVLRLAAGGAWGSDGSLPQSISAGDTHQMTYHIALSSQWVPGRVTLVGMIQEFGQEEEGREILNSAALPLIPPPDVNPTDTLGTTPDTTLATNLASNHAASLSIRAFPNPSQGALRCSFELPQAGRAKLLAYDVHGNKVYTLLPEKAMGKGPQVFTWYCTDTSGRRLAPGLYHLSLQTTGGNATTRVLLLGGR